MKTIILDPSNAKELEQKLNKIIYTQPENKDICLKDEGDFTTVIFMTNKAQQALKSDPMYNEFKEHVYGDKVLKIDIANESIRNILAWAVTHRLTIGF